MAEPLRELIAQRLRKLGELRQMGMEPFGGAFECSHTAAQLRERFGPLDGQSLEEQSPQVSVAGRLMSIRDFGKAAFSHLQDSSGRLQLYFKRDVLGEDFRLFKKYIDIGDILGARGRLFKTRTGELTVEVRGFELLCKALRPLPEKWHGLRDVEARYRQRYLDLLVNPQVKEVFLLRSRVIKALREALDKRGFLEVETPMMHPVAGGAAAKPFRTHHIALGIDLYLRIAPELYLKRLLVGGLERIYELGKCFRNEGISTKHNPEFTMLEFYVAYKDYRWLMDFTEELLCEVAERTTGGLKLRWGQQEVDLTPPWPRLTMRQALLRHGVPQGVLESPQQALAFARDRGIEVPQGASHAKLLDEIFQETVEPHLLQPTFITEHPWELSPLAKQRPDAPHLVERFELFVGGREIVNAFSELNDPLEQRRRFELQLQARAQGDLEAHPMDEDFLRALEHGMPPAAGEGIGVDRLVMLLANAPSIREVILFPQLRPE
jgi:lysyl-tRNA synthetase class 2